MPYDSINDLPEAVKALPKHAQEIWLAAFNAAFDEYDGDEGKAAAVAWAAVKKAGYSTGDDRLRHRYEQHERILDVNQPKLRITSVLSTQVLADDGLVLIPDGVKTVVDPIPQLWVHGRGLRDWLPTGSVSNLRVERVHYDGLGDVPALIGDRTYYSPGDAVKHLTSDAVTLPAVIYDMKVQGHFKGLSIGFSVSEYEARPIEYRLPGWTADAVLQQYALEPGHAPHATSWYLHEVSDVPTGSDPLALDIVVSRAFDLSPRQKEIILGHAGRACAPEATQQTAQQPVRSVLELLGDFAERKV